MMARLLAARDEAREVRTIWLHHEMKLQPGQFIMLWIPRLDEKPYAVSALAPGRIAVTVRRRGSFSTRLMEMQRGDAVGVRGPYGNGFVPAASGIIVAGGCGLAPLALLKEMMPDAQLICGAQTEVELMFRDRFKDMIICTDDGSAGHHGFPTDILREQLAQAREKTVYTCGPEAMMRAVFDICEEYGASCQAGLERYMKCGFGVCGQCACDEMLVCRDGPVFASDALRQMPEFGHMRRLKDGRRVNV